MHNLERAKFDALASENKRMARLEAKTPSTVWEPPIKRHVPDLIDWIADNPSFKQSRSYNRLMDAYYESVQHSCR